MFARQHKMPQAQKRKASSMQRSSKKVKKKTKRTRGHGRIARRQQDESGNAGANENANENDDDPADDDQIQASKKRKTEQRLLYEIPERGVGNCARHVNEYVDIAPFMLPTASRLVTPWNLQICQVINFNIDGAWSNNLQREWCKSNDVDEFANLFYTPWDERVPIRRISTDIEHAQVKGFQTCTNSTQKVVHFLKSTHAQTELDLIHGKFIQKVFVGLQQTSRELMLAMHGGAFGGMSGCADAVLFHISHGEMVTNVNTDILHLVELISEALHGTHGDELCPCVATHYTEPVMKGRRGMNRVQAGARTVRQYNLHEAGIFFLLSFFFIFECLL